MRDADVAIVYYAGHGIEIDGTNYLIPTDATLERDIDAYDEAISLDRLLAVIEPARKLRLIILDACRDNPFSKSMKRTVASRAIGRGLAKVDPGSPNTLVAFAAKAGSTASDGDGKNSPFTAALVKYLPKPGLDLRKAFGFARDEVLKTTGNRQEPFIYGSLGGEDFALVAAPAAAPVSDPGQAVRSDYELAERVGTREAWDFFLGTYPDGFYAKLALAQRNKLEAEQSRLVAIERSRSAEDERARLAAEGARAGAQAKAAAEAKAADEARVTAERKKALEEARIAEVERAQAKAAEENRLAAERKQEFDLAKAAEAEQARLVLKAKAAADARIAAENARAAAEAEVRREQLALERARALAEEKVSVATQWQLMWWRFRKHRLGVLSAIVILLYYVAIVFAEFLAYSEPTVSEAQRGLIAPQPIFWFDGGSFSPYVHPLAGTRDPQTFKRVYNPDLDRKIPVRFFGIGIFVSSGSVLTVCGIVCFFGFGSFPLMRNLPLPSFITFIFISL